MSLKCMTFQFTVYLKKIVDLFSQSYNLERPNSDAKISFSVGWWVKDWKDLKEQKCETKVFYMSEENGSRK